MKKIRAWRKKNTDDPREESITVDPEEEPITEDSMETLKRILSIRNLKRTLSLENLKTTLSMKILGNFRILNDFCAAKKNIFSFLVTVYDRMGDEDKFSYENFGLGRCCFNATSHLKIEAKVFLFVM